MDLGVKVGKRCAQNFVELPRAVLALEFAVAAGQLDLDVLRADAGGALGVPGLERVHECASGR